MSVIAPAPSGSRGEVILQPAYFTSSIFVNAFRDDLSALILAHNEKYATTDSPRPFPIFKDLWSSQGWKWLHFMVFDNRTRHAFLNTVLRLFLERAIGNESPQNSAVALFACYTFFYTQPQDTAPPLHTVVQIPIPLDHYLTLQKLPQSFNTERLLPFQAPVNRILSILQKDQIFFLLPSSNLGPLNPRSLPREIFIEDDASMPIITDGLKKKGRPTKRDKAKKARVAAEGLDKWLDRNTTEGTTQQPLVSSLTRYQMEKSSLLQNAAAEALLGFSQAQSAIERGNQFVLERLREADQFELSSQRGTDEKTGLPRVERAVQELVHPVETNRQGGALSLLEGAGRT